MFVKYVQVYLDMLENSVSTTPFSPTVFHSNISVYSSIAAEFHYNEPSTESLRQFIASDRQNTESQDPSMHREPRDP